MRSAVLIALLSVALGANPASSQTWQQSGAGPFSWTTAGNWSPASVPNSITAEATLPNILVANQFVTLDAVITLGVLNLTSTTNSYTIGGGSGGSFVFNNGGGGAFMMIGPGSLVQAITADISIADPMGLTVSHAGTGDLLFGGNLSGNGLVKAGGGTLVLTGTNNYTFTNLTAGVLQLGNGGTTGTLGSSAVATTSGTQLRFNHSNTQTVANTISGAGALVKDGGDLARLILTANSTFSGGTTINSGTLQVGNGGTTGSLGSGAIVNHATLEYNLSTNPLVFNVISGSGVLVKSGPGTLTLAGNNTYTGGTVINGGAVQTGNGGSLGTGPVTNNVALQLSVSTPQTLANTIAGTGGLVVNGTNTVTLTGNNTYTGGTQVLGGSLALGGQPFPNSATGTGNVTVASGARLTGRGDIAGGLTLQSGGILEPLDFPTPLQGALFRMGGGINTGSGSEVVTRVKGNMMAAMPDTGNSTDMMNTPSTNTFASTAIGSMSSLDGGTFFRFISETPTGYAPSESYSYLFGRFEGASAQTLAPANITLTNFPIGTTNISVKILPGGDAVFNFTTPAAVPEPALLLALALPVLGMLRRRGAAVRR